MLILAAVFILVTNWFAAYYNLEVWVELGSDLNLGMAVFSFTFGLLMAINVVEL